MRLVEFIRECLEIAEDQGVEELLAFATSAMREAPNGDTIIERVWEETGVALEVLSGVDESRVTFLAARRWFGWSSGRLLVIDIGGGSLELASGIDEDPDVAISLPLGAGRLTRERLPGDPPTAQESRAVRSYIRATVARQVRPLLKAPTPDRVVGTSKTMRSLARIAGAAPRDSGPFVRGSCAARTSRRSSTSSRDSTPRRGCRFPVCPRPAPTRCSPVHSSPRRRWTCSTSTGSTSVPGRSGKA